MHTSGTPRSTPQPSPVGPHHDREPRGPQSLTDGQTAIKVGMYVMGFFFILAAPCVVSGALCGLVALLAGSSFPILSIVAVAAGSTFLLIGAGVIPYLSNSQHRQDIDQALNRRAIELYTYLTGR